MLNKLYLNDGNNVKTKVTLDNYKDYMIFQKSITDVQNLFLVYCTNKAFDLKINEKPTVQSIYEDFYEFFNEVLSNASIESYGNQKAISENVNRLINAFLFGIKSHIVTNNLGSINMYFNYNYMYDLNSKLPNDKKFKEPEGGFKEELYKLVVSLNDENTLVYVIEKETQYKKFSDTKFSYENGILNVMIKDLFNLLFVAEISLNAYKIADVNTEYAENTFGKFFAELLLQTVNYISAYNTQGTIVYFNELVRVSSKPSALIYIMDKDLLHYMVENSESVYKDLIQYMLDDSTSEMDYTEYENKLNKNYTNVYFDMFVIPNKTYQKDLSSLYDFSMYLLEVSKLQNLSTIVEKDLKVVKDILAENKIENTEEKQMFLNFIKESEDFLEMFSGYKGVYKQVENGVMTVENPYKLSKRHYLRNASETLDGVEVTELPDFEVNPELYTTPILNSSDLISRTSEMYLLKYPLKDDAYSIALEDKYKDLRLEIVETFIELD